MNKRGHYRVDDMPNPDSSGNNTGAIPPETPKPSTPKRKSWLKIAIIVVVTLVVVGSVLYFIGHKSPKPKGHVSGQKIVQVTPSTSSSTITKYLSNGNDLNLSFNYPNNWTVTPISNDNKNDQAITLTSPLTTVINANNDSIVGKIVIQVRPGTDTASELNSNSPIASLASTQIAYSQPTPNQTSYPFISFIHFSDGSKATGSFEEVMITGGLSFSQGQSISAQNVSGLDPIISANFYQCASQSCTGSSESFLSINLDTWQNTTIFKQVLAIFESFQLN